MHITLSLLERYIRTFPAMPEMRSHELSLALEKAIRDSGGDIWYNCEVTELLFDGETICGVAVGERKWYAGHIVLNCFPSTAYSQLMEASKVPEKAAKIDSARRPGSLFFTVNLGLNRSCDELGIGDYSVFLFDSPDAGQQSRYAFRHGAQLYHCQLSEQGCSECFSERHLHAVSYHNAYRGSMGRGQA
ncbi:MAG: hypothetical protein ACLR23_17050 [Clostridia bacterium]